MLHYTIEISEDGQSLTILLDSDVETILEATALGFVPIRGTAPVRWYAATVPQILPLAALQARAEGLANRAHQRAMSRLHEAQTARRPHLRLVRLTQSLMPAVRRAVAGPIERGTATSTPGGNPVPSYVAMHDAWQDMLAASLERT